MAAVTMPTVHMNGSSGDVLAQGYADAAAAIRTAITVTEAAAPNARDYYVQDAAAYGRARAEHEARLARLRATMDELIELARGVRAQVRERSAR